MAVLVAVLCSDTRSSSKPTSPKMNMPGSQPSSGPRLSAKPKAINCSAATNKYTLARRMSEMRDSFSVRITRKLSIKRPIVRKKAMIK